VRFVLSNETFGFQVLVCIETRRSDCYRGLQAKFGIKNLTAREIIDNSSALGSFFSMDKGTACALWLRDLPRKANSIAVLCHEAVHLSRHVTKRTGAYSEETQAYLTEWLVREVLTRVGK
jgi:hypothetical protein